MGSRWMLKSGWLEKMLEDKSKGGMTSGMGVELSERDRQFQ